MNSVILYFIKLRIWVCTIDGPFQGQETLSFAICFPSSLHSAHHVMISQRFVKLVFAGDTRHWLNK